MLQKKITAKITQPAVLQ